MGKKGSIIKTTGGKKDAYKCPECGSFLISCKNVRCEKCDSYIIDARIGKYIKKKETLPEPRSIKKKTPPKTI